VKSSRPSPHLATPAELKARIEAERVGDPFVVYRDEGDEQRIVTLHGTMRELTIGRHDECDVTLDWDQQVSGLHTNCTTARVTGSSPTTGSLATAPSSTATASWSVAGSTTATSSRSARRC
jgi:hypothetical protein